MKTRWLMVVPVVILFAAAVNLYRHNRDETRAREIAAREAALRGNLTQIRKAIENFRRDNARPPHALQELAPRYLARIPADPLTNAADWRLITEERVEPSSDFTTGDASQSRAVIIDVRSAAPGRDASGRLYSDY